MDYPYSITFKFSQQIEVFAKDSREAIDKARAQIKVDEKEMNSFGYSVKKKPAGSEDVLQESRLPFKPKKGKYKEKA
jgi:hypothetical protein